MAEEVIIKIATDADLSDAETLEDLIEKLRSEASDIPLDFDETPAEDDVDGLTEKLDALSTVAVGQVLSQYGSEAENMAQQMNTASISVGQLATNVGMAEPQMVSMINHISNATFPQNEAMAYVGALNQMGVSANNLGASATNMDRINDATGIGYQKVMQLTQGLQAVGISADNLPASFNAIAYAQANVNGGADTLSMVLKRQAATINEYGLNVDQLVLIMQKLSEQGVQGMKMGSELSKVLKETNGDTAALEQSLGLQAGALSNASAATGQYSGKLQDLADEEAEHKTILDQLNAAWEDVSLSMSPIITPLSSIMGMIGQAGSWAVGVNGLIQLANSMRGLSVVTYLKAAADTVAAGAQWLLNAAMSANPIMLVVIALVALVAALVWAYYNVDWFRAMVDNAFASLQQLAGIIMGAITGAINWVAGLFQQFTAQLGLNTNDWGQAILGFILFLPTLPLRVAAELANVIAHALGFKGNFIQTLWDTAMGAVENFANAIQGIPRALQACLDWAYNIVMSNPLVQALQWLGEQAVNAFSIMGLNQGSPGDIVRSMENELNWTKQAVLKSDLADTTQKLGASLSDSFDPHLANGTLNGSVMNGSIGGQVNNFYFSDVVVDNDERMNRIVEYVRKSIHWNNQTAGRSV